jgi:hypothetical protein
MIVGGTAALLGSVLAVEATAQSITACGQTIKYTLVAPQADVPETVRTFSGVWSGSWGNQLCHVLVVENVSKDGTVSAKYAYGTNPGWNIREPGVRQMSGKISGNTLVLQGNNLSIDYKAAAPGTLSGTYRSAGGNSAGTFKKQ